MTLLIPPAQSQEISCGSSYFASSLEWDAVAAPPRSLQLCGCARGVVPGERDLKRHLGTCGGRILAAPTLLVILSMKEVASGMDYEAAAWTMKQL
jgi:hypothetical protein